MIHIYIYYMYVYVYTVCMYTYIYIIFKLVNSKSILSILCTCTFVHSSYLYIQHCTICNMYYSIWVNSILTRHSLHVFNRWWYHVYTCMYMYVHIHSTYMCTHVCIPCIKVPTTIYVFLVSFGTADDPCFRKLKIRKKK